MAEPKAATHRFECAQVTRGGMCDCGPSLADLVAEANGSRDGISSSAWARDRIADYYRFGWTDALAEGYFGGECA